MWTWLSGSSNVDANGKYEKLGLQSLSNTPGGRYQFSMSVDEKSASIYIFGGYGLGANPKRNVIACIFIFLIEIFFRILCFK